MLMQVVDFLHLFDHFGCRLQGGGNDHRSRDHDQRRDDIERKDLEEQVDGRGVADRPIQPAQVHANRQNAAQERQRSGGDGLAKVELEVADGHRQ